jgi:hypothetical protein
MKQQTFATVNGFEKPHRTTKKAAFLIRRERWVLWSEFYALIESYTPKAENGRPPVGLERMLRMYFLANWLNLADEACEEALYDIPLFREFCRIGLGKESAPDASTLLGFRHLVEARELLSGGSGQAIAFIHTLRWLHAIALAATWPSRRPQGLPRRDARAMTGVMRIRLLICSNSRIASPARRSG